MNDRFGRKENLSLRKFDYSYLADRTWDNEIMYCSKIFPSKVYLQQQHLLQEISLME